MTNSQTSRLAVIAVIAASLLAVGVVTAISIVKQADAQSVSVDIRNRIRQSADASVTQSITTGAGGSCSTCSNTASVTQSNTASQANTVGINVNSPP